MKKILFILFALAFCLPQNFRAQIPTGTLVRIVKAEDERRYDAALENLLKNADVKIRRRAALAAGRIGDERAIPALIGRLNDEPAIAAMSLFALGEIESPNAAPEIAEILKNSARSNEIRARAIEAAGKIAAANPKDAQTPELGKAIVSALESEFGKNLARHRETVLLGITAILRARPAGGETITAKFLDDSDARIRADALNTLARLRSKNVNDKARELLARDLDPNVRANAARMLGVGEDKSAIELLLNAATKDVDSRVRVSAIRSLGNFKDERIGQPLIVQMRKLTIDYAEIIYKKKYEKPSQQNELLEITSTLGKLYANTSNQAAIKVIDSFNRFDKYESPEVQVAYARIAPELYIKESDEFFGGKRNDFTQQMGQSLAAGLNEFVNLPDEKIALRKEAALQSLSIPNCSDSLKTFVNFRKDKPLQELNLPTTSYDDYLARLFKNILNSAMPSNKLEIIFSENCGDAISRASIAEIMSEFSPTKGNIEALKSAFTKSLLTDKHENDAQLAILNALYKLDKKASVGTFTVALGAPDYLVRKRAFEILKDRDLQKDFPGIRASLESFAAKKRNQVLPYAAYTGTKLGQIFYTNADYVRAASRKNGTVKAVLKTTKGVFAIDFYPEDAPLAVDNFIRLARTGYFNNVSVHRVVPNFVMQTGDPRGDGSGGPGWQIRCEINTLPYERGAVGMALSGKDTGGSQWFATHSPQPHLDGGYTVFGKINETDMKIVDNIARGDKILRVSIIENAPKKKR